MKRGCIYLAAGVRQNYKQGICGYCVTWPSNYGKERYVLCHSGSSNKDGSGRRAKIDRENRPLYLWRVSGRCSYQVWKCAPAARYLIYSVGQQGKGLLSAGHGYLQIINQGSFQKPGIVYLLFFCNPFQPCRESDVCLDALIILFHAE